MAPIELSHFADKAKRDLLQLLQSVPGKKNLVLQKALVGPVELLFAFSALQEQGVDRVFFLENQNLDSSQRHVIFIVSGEKAHQAQAVASQIQLLQRTSQSDHDFSVFWVPRRTLICEKILEEAGVLGDVASREWPLYLQPLAKDLLSMELDDSFAELYLRQDPTSIFLSARALMLIQQQHGLFPRIQGKGNRAKHLADLLVRMRTEQAADQGSSFANAISTESLPSVTIQNVVILDREIDFATPLLTQLTYEGLLDERFGIHHNQVEVSSSVLGTSSSSVQYSQATSSREGVDDQKQTSTLKRKVKLDNSDSLYAELRSANFAIVGSLLNRVARRLQSFQNDYQGKQGNNKTIAELRDLLTKVPGYQAEQQSLKLHVGLAEEVMKFTQSDTFRSILEIQQNSIAGTDPASLNDLMEQLIARDCSLPTALRLLCLLCVAAGGLRAKDLDTFKRQILQAYGYQHLLTLAALEKMLLLHSRTGLSAFTIPVTSSATGGSASTRTDYSSIRRPLHLIVDEVSEQDPTDVAYTYSGYAPLSIRVIQCLLQKAHLASLAKSVSIVPQTAAPSANSASSAEAAPSWSGYEDVLKSIAGPTFDIEQRPFPDEEKSAAARQTLNGTADIKTTLVFFLGGVTFGEIAALRFVAKEEGDRRNIIIGTTGIINADKMMKAAIDESIRSTDR